MRTIRLSQIAVFLVLFGVALAAALAVTALAFGALPLGDFRGITLVAIAVVLLYVFGIAVYRLFLAVVPLREGEIAEGSQQEFVYHVYILFYLLLFYPVIRSGLLPTPLMRVFYLALGTRLGKNTYSQGIIHDPPFIEVGDDSTIGQSALLVPHVIEGRKLAHYPIRIGNNVTIGAQSVVLPGVEIGDGAIVATGAVVTKGTRIAPGEVWGGVPARPLQGPAERAVGAG